MATDPMHGTHVSGIIAAERNNSIGVNGIADNVRIMMIRAVQTEMNMIKISPWLFAMQ